MLYKIIHEGNKGEVLATTHTRWLAIEIQKLLQGYLINSKEDIKIIEVEEGLVNGWDQSPSNSR